MSRRLRFYGAILSLLAFSAYSAERVWAAACDPAMGSGMDHAALQQESPREAEPMHDHAPADAEAPAEPGGDVVPCPIAAGSTGSCVSLTLLTDHPDSKFAAPELSLTGPATAAHGDLLIATTLFHPPRA